jgi:hypothetical protein
MKYFEKIGSFGLFFDLSDEYKEKWLQVEDISLKNDSWIGIYNLYNLIKYAFLNCLITIDDVNVFLNSSNWGGKLPLKNREDVLRNI